MTPSDDKGQETCLLAVICPFQSLTTWVFACSGSAQKWSKKEDILLLLALLSLEADPNKQ